MTPPPARRSPLAQLPRLSFPDYLAMLADPNTGWQQGEHFSLVGPTGCGKTTFTTAILPLRDYVLSIATKPTSRPDPSLARMTRRGYKRIRSYADRPPILPDGTGARLLLWPEFERPEDVIGQQLAIDRALREAFVDGGWCINGDELWYLCQRLKLAPLLELIWSQGRALDLSLVGGTQRPAWVPLMMYDQATHLALWRDNDDTNLRRIGGLGGLDSRLLRESVADLPKHDALCVNTRTGSLCVTRAPAGG